MRVIAVREESERGELSEDLLEKIAAGLESDGGSLEVIDIRPGDVAYCLGCLWCWHTGNGRCRMHDRVPELEEQVRGADLLVFVSPLRFGTMSSSIKSLIDRGFGCKFYGEGFYPQFVIGYGEDAAEEERATFLDITLLHRGTEDIVHPELAGIPVGSAVTGSKEENSVVAARVLEFAGAEVSP